MIFKTPDFWYRKPASPPPRTELALLPLSRLYRIGRAIHRCLQTPERAGIPVICVGNAVAGGSGKTPAALALRGLIEKHGLAAAPFFLTRGYGGALSGPVQVAEAHSFYDAGDESLLLARSAPTVISRNRPEGAKLAQSKGADIIIMDDGLQNGTIAKDITFMVIDGGAGFGNGRVLPAGPLREPLGRSFAKTDAFILIGKDARDVTLSLPAGKPLFHARVEPRLPPGLDLSKPVVAFAGLGRPEKFYHLLQHLEADIAGWHAFADHHVYCLEDLRVLESEAEAKGATLLTTEKDAVRLRDIKATIPLHVLPIDVVFEEEQAVVDFLKNRLKLAP